MYITVLNNDYYNKYFIYLIYKLMFVIFVVFVVFLSPCERHNMY